MAYYLNFRKSGTTYQVPLVSSLEASTPAGVPPFCVRAGGATYYAFVSKLSTYAVASYRSGGTTYYLVTTHAQSEVVSWTTVLSKTSGSATTYTLPSQYDGYPVLFQCAGASGSTGSAGGDTSFSKSVQENTGSTQTPNYVTYETSVYIYGGAGASGGKGIAAETFAGHFASGTVFTISRVDGATGGTGSTGTNPSETTYSAKAGGAGGAGGIGFSVSGKNMVGETKTCYGYGGGGGGGGGGAGGLGETLTRINQNSVPRYTYATGKGGTGGKSGSVSGSAGTAGHTDESTNGGRSDLRNYVTYSSSSHNATVSYNISRAYGKGGAGASSGSSSSAYCYIKVGSLR